MAVLVNGFLCSRSHLVISLVQQIYYKLQSVDAVNRLRVACIDCRKHMLWIWQSDQPCLFVHIPAGPGILCSSLG